MDPGGALVLLESTLKRTSKDMQEASVIVAGGECYSCKRQCTDVRAHCNASAADVSGCSGAEVARNGTVEPESSNKRKRVTTGKSDSE